MERLTAEDLVMLWPDELWPQEVGCLAILDGTSLIDSTGDFLIEKAQAAIAARLHLVPRFRQILYRPHRGLGSPLWIDAPAFDLRDHTRVRPLGTPAEESQLLGMTEQLIARRLDQSRPLWEMWFLPGLPEHRIGLLIKIHHAMVDGIAGLATIGALLNPWPYQLAEPKPAWAPTPAPPDRDLLADNLSRHLAGLGRAFSILTHLRTTQQQVRAKWPALNELIRDRRGPVTSLDRVVGPDRNLAIIRGSLELIKQIADSYDATLNDVLLAIVAGGLRGLLRNRGEAVEDLTLPSYVPVTLRHAVRDQARGNLIGQMVVPLPIGISKSGRRLRQIAAETATPKARSRPSLGTLLWSGPARWALLKVLHRQPVNVNIADLPGPQVPLYLAEARVLEAYPVLPLVARVSLAVGGLSYAGQFNIMAVADHDVGPDLDIFTASLQEDLDALAARLSDEEK